MATELTENGGLRRIAQVFRSTFIWDEATSAVEALFPAISGKQIVVLGYTVCKASGANGNPTITFRSNTAAITHAVTPYQAGIPASVYDRDGVMACTEGEALNGLVTGSGSMHLCYILV